jgi:segregation and condensation protein A
MTDDGTSAVLELPVGSATEPAEMDLGYQVSLANFAGPLDLLLFLVRRAEVDIADIPIAQITDQFIALIHNAEEIDLDIAGDFILMAATLLEMKSRLVVPPEENAEENDNARDDELIDPRAGLVRQLLTYRRFKEATTILPQLEEAQEQRIGRRYHEIIPEDSDEIDGLDLTNCDVMQLYDCFEVLLVRINRLGPRTVINDDVPLEHKIHYVIDTMRGFGEHTMQQFFTQETGISGRIGIIMATLECTRQRFIEAKQLEQFGAVYLRFRSDEERNRAPESLPTENTEEQKKRRKRIPLVTWRAPVQETIFPVEDKGEKEDGDAEIIHDEEIIVESDEQRFVREIEETCHVDAVLTRTADLENSFAQFKITQAEQAKQAEIEKAQQAEAARVAAELKAQEIITAESDNSPAVETVVDIANEKPKRPRTKPARRTERPAKPREPVSDQFHGIISNAEEDDDFFDDPPLVGDDNSETTA